jgi:MATE family multidrug resistance protein
MGGIGVVLALAGPAILPLFTGAHDADASAAVALGSQLLWIAAGYQVFDGINLGSAMCLRGAGDAAVPASLVVLMSWILFVPLAYVLTFAPGEGWIHGVPQLGWGAIGGWLAVLIYIMVLGSALLARWRSHAWWARASVLAAAH